jgi:hypothetical protein
MISWSEIEAECGDYRAGFVAIFRKYEGQPTDEKDEQGRTVKVTRTAFARHMGIPETTFRGWTKSAARAVLPEHRARMDISRVKKTLAGASSKQVEQIIRELPAEQQQTIVKAAPAAVSKALATDDGFAFEAMTEHQARLNTAAAGYKHSQAAQAQVDSEEKARNKSRMSREEYDGLLLLKLGGVEQRVIAAAEVMARNWRNNRNDLSEEALDLALDHLAGTQVKLNKIIDEILGKGLDAVLAEIQSE